MSSVIDVQNALVNVIAAALYPSGTSQPSVSNSDIIVYAGWPTASNLDADLLVSKSHVTVFATPTEKNVTRFPKDWQQLSIETATLTASVVGQTIVIGGAMPAPFTPHNMVALVNGQPYIYSVLPADTLTSIATALKALIVVGVPGTTSAGAVITLPATANIDAARVGVTGTSIREVRRQEKLFQITVWTDTPDRREVIGNALDLELATTEYLIMPDTFGARLIYRNSIPKDETQKAKLYRWDFFYSVEFATTETRSDMQITQIQQNIALQVGGATAPAGNLPTYL